MQKAIDEVRSLSSKLAEKERQLRNQALEMEQIEEELAARNRLVDLEVRRQRISNSRAAVGGNAAVP